MGQSQSAATGAIQVCAIRVNAANTVTKIDSCFNDVPVPRLPATFCHSTLMAFSHSSPTPTMGAVPTSASTAVHDTTVHSVHNSASLAIELVVVSTSTIRPGETFLLCSGCEVLPRPTATRQLAIAKGDGAADQTTGVGNVQATATDAARSTVAEKTLTVGADTFGVYPGGHVRPLRTPARQPAVPTGQEAASENTVWSFLGKWLFGPIIYYILPEVLYLWVLVPMGEGFVSVFDERRSLRTTPDRLRNEDCPKGGTCKKCNADEPSSHMFLHASPCGLHFAWLVSEGIAWLGSCDRSMSFGLRGLVAMNLIVLVELAIGFGIVTNRQSMMHGHANDQKWVLVGAEPQERQVEHPAYDSGRAPPAVHISGDNMSDWETEWEKPGE